MSTSILEEKIFCGNLDCQKPITGFAKKNNRRFCLDCQQSNTPLRWKCKREGCHIIMYSTNYASNRFYCSNECIRLARKSRSKTERNKKIKITKDYAKQIYEYFIKSNIPIYKLSALHQACVKFIVLNYNNTRLTPGEKRKRRVRISLKYQFTHSQQYRNYQREYKQLFVFYKFAKFWDRVEDKK